MSAAWKSLTFGSHRSPVIAGDAMICCTQPLAAEAGARILRAGGNAADACVAIAACMNVCEPTSTGIGGDCFALYYDPNVDPSKVHAMNGSGRSAAALSRDLAIASCFPAGAPEGDDLLGMPSKHACCVTVPGTAAGWDSTLSKWGTMSLATVLAPAIQLCERGVPVPPITARMWQDAEAHLLAGPHPAAMLLADHSSMVSAASVSPSEGAAAGTVGSTRDRPRLRAPRAGEIHKKPGLARTFKRIAERGSRDGFYRGQVAEAIEAVVKGAGGCLTAADLAEHETEFCEPLSVTYTPVLPSDEAAKRIFGSSGSGGVGAGRGFPAREVRVFECPPNGQGITALMALQIQEAVLRGDPGAAEELAGRAQDESGADGQALEASAEAVVKAAAEAEGFTAAGEPSSWFAPLSPAAMHVQIEAMRLAFADTRWLVRDPDDAFAAAGGKGPAGKPAGERKTALLEWESMLRPEYAASRASRIQRKPCRAAVDVRRGSPMGSCDTVSFSVVDGEGRACSFIQSNYAGFGTNLIPDGWGFTLQNRGANFTLREGAPNCVGPRKRPYHTIIPGMALHGEADSVAAGLGAPAASGAASGSGSATGRADSRLLYNFSCMGGFMQPQGHL